MIPSSIRKIWAIIINTFREAVRDRILYAIVFFAVIILLLSMIMDVITIGQRAKIIIDTGLASISIFGTLIAIFVGIGLVYKEIDKRTIYTIVSKPVARWQFLLGKYFGLVLTLLVEVAAMSAIFFIIVINELGTVPPLLFLAVGLTFIELMIVCAVAILFSSFSTPILSGMYTLGVYLIGHLTRSLYQFSFRFEGTFLQKLMLFLYYFFPNLDNFNIRSQAVHGLPVDTSYILFAVGYGIMYITVLLVVSSYIFSRRDFR
jgi:ABC-type transport system involved in multi-copper enzyme maturation permease subunit